VHLILNLIFFVGKFCFISYLFNSNPELKFAYMVKRALDYPQITKGITREMFDNMQIKLQQMFPDSVYEIIISESEDDDHGDRTETTTSSSVENNNILPLVRNLKIKPSNQPSISTYMLKKTVMAPANVYAKPHNGAVKREIISVEYKESKAPKNTKHQTPYDPRKEATLLNGLKEKLYRDQYIKLPKEEKEKIERDCESGYTSVEPKTKTIKNNSRPKRKSKDEPKKVKKEAGTKKIMNESTMKRDDKEKPKKVQEENEYLTDEEILVEMSERKTRSSARLLRKY
jgi:hypothetical protein